MVNFFDYLDILLSEQILPGVLALVFTFVVMVVSMRFIKRNF